MGVYPPSQASSIVVMRVNCQLTVFLCRQVYGEILCAIVPNIIQIPKKTPQQSSKSSVTSAVLTGTFFYFYFLVSGPVMADWFVFDIAADRQMISRGSAMLAPLAPRPTAQHTPLPCSSLSSLVRRGDVHFFRSKRPKPVSCGAPPLRAAITGVPPAVKEPPGGRGQLRPFPPCAGVPAAPRRNPLRAQHPGAHTNARRGLKAKKYWEVNTEYLPTIWYVQPKAGLPSSSVHAFLFYTDSQPNRPSILADPYHSLGPTHT